MEDKASPRVIEKQQEVVSSLVLTNGRLQRHNGPTPDSSFLSVRCGQHVKTQRSRSVGLTLAEIRRVTVGIDRS